MREAVGGHIRMGRWRGGAGAGAVIVVIAAVIAAAPAAARDLQRRTDTDPPRTLFNGPSGLIRDSQPTFMLDSDEPGSTFSCALDGSPYFPCGPLYTPPRPLAEGPHEFLAYATDRAGNSDPLGVKVPFTVDRSISGARLLAPRSQPFSRSKPQINVKLGGQEKLGVRVKGIIRIGKRRLGARPIKRSLGDRTSIRPKLTMKRSVGRAIDRALDRRKRVEVELRARFRDQVGNEITKKRTIVLR